MYILLLGVFPEKDIKPDLNRFLENLVTDKVYDGIDYMVPSSETLKSILDMDNIPNTLPDTKLCKVKDLPKVDENFITTFGGYIYEGCINHVFMDNIPNTLSHYSKNLKDKYNDKVKEISDGIKEMISDASPEDMVVLLDAYV